MLVWGRSGTISGPTHGEAAPNAVLRPLLGKAAVNRHVDAGLEISWVEPDFPSRRVGLVEEDALALYADFHAARPADEAPAFLAGFRLDRAAVFETSYAQGACILHDSDAKQLYLWRSALSDRALYWRSDPGGCLCFASIPALLRRPDDRFDFDQLGRFASHAWPDSQRTAFEEIHLLPPGHLLTATSDGVKLRRTWDPSAVSPQGYGSASAAEDVRSALDQAVAHCIDPGMRPIASQLSGGRDSSAVTALVTAKAGRDRVIALTAAPVSSFGGPAAADESGHAKSTAEAVGIEHHVIHSDGRNFADRLDRLTALLGGPIVNMKALNWWDDVAAAAAGAGAKVMLTGTIGNYTISSGGAQALSSLLWEEGWTAFVRNIPGAFRQLSKKSLMSVLFPSVSEGRIGRIARRFVGKTSERSLNLRFLRGPVRDAGERARRALVRNHGFPGDYRARVADLLGRADLDDLPTVLSHRLDIRDPTADRKLAELVLSLPSRLLVDGHSPRPLFAAAFGDLVPEEVTQATWRGIQGADWYLQFRPSELEEAIRRYESVSDVSRFVDLDEMLDFLDHWPESHEASVRLQADCVDFLNALAMAAFLYWAGSTKPS